MNAPDELKLVSAENERICREASSALEELGFYVPDHGYGENTTWAIASLCKALRSTNSRLKHFEEYLERASDQMEIIKISMHRKFIHADGKMWHE